MIRRLLVLPKARNDLDEAALWYDEQRSGLGQEFLAEATSVIATVATSPGIHHCVRRNPEIRRALTKRFPFRIYFVVEPDAVVVFRVLHTSRHDREWKRAIPGQQHGR